MKKHLLLGLAIGMGGFAVAQRSVTPAVTPSKMKPAVANKVGFYKKNQLPGSETTVAPSFSSIVNSLRPAPAASTRAYTTTTIGTTG